jgi:hypothetical protein
MIAFCCALYKHWQTLWGKINVHHLFILQEDRVYKSYNGNHSVSDMLIRALCPISGSNDSRKRHEMHLISKLGTVHPSGINERFSYV